MTPTTRTTLRQRLSLRKNMDLGWVFLSVVSPSNSFVLKDDHDNNDDNDDGVKTDNVPLPSTPLFLLPLVFLGGFLVLPSSSSIHRRLYRHHRHHRNRRICRFVRISLSPFHVAVSVFHPSLSLSPCLLSILVVSSLSLSLSRARFLTLSP